MGNTAVSKSSARNRCNGGGTFLPPRCRSTASARVTFHRQRMPNIGTANSACTSSFSRVPRVQHVEQLLDRKAVLRSDRKHDAVVVGAGLQLEIKRAAEALAQRQAPGPIDARAERRMNHELHAARFVEEPLEHDLPPRRHDANRNALRGHIIHGLLRGPVIAPHCPSAK